MYIYILKLFPMTTQLFIGRYRVIFFAANARVRTEQFRRYWFRFNCIKCVKLICCNWICSLQWEDRLSKPSSKLESTIRILLLSFVGKLINDVVFSGCTRWNFSLWHLIVMMKLLNISGHARTTMYRFIKHLVFWILVKRRSNWTMSTIIVWKKVFPWLLSKMEKLVLLMIF